MEYESQTDWKDKFKRMIYLFGLFNNPYLFWIEYDKHRQGYVMSNFMNRIACDTPDGCSLIIGDGRYIGFPEIIIRLVNFKYVSDNPEIKYSVKHDHYIIKIDPSIDVDKINITDIYEFIDDDIELYMANYPPTYIRLVSYNLWLSLNKINKINYRFLYDNYDDIHNGMALFLPQIMEYLTHEEVAFLREYVCRTMI